MALPASGTCGLCTAETGRAATSNATIAKIIESFFMMVLSLSIGVST
jgi:hypothetical protein